MDYFWSPSPAVHNLSCLDDLNRVDISACIAAVSIHEEIPDNLLKKLKQIVSKNQLTELVLIDSFDNPDKLCEILKALQGNPNIKQLSLDLRNNKHNLDCAREICKFIRRKVLVSLALPEGLDETCTAEILYEITSADLKLKLLNISESELNEDAIKYLEEILKNRNVYKQLILKKCEGVSETTLTTKDHERLAEAETKGRRLFFHRKVTITWFNYVKHVESGDMDTSEWEVAEIEENIPTFFKGKAGKFEQVVRYIARNKKGGPWQLLSGRKRRSDEPTRPSKVRKEEVDGLTEMFGKHSMGVSNLQTNPQGISSNDFQRNYQLPGTSGSNIEKSKTPNMFQAPINTGLTATAANIPLTNPAHPSFGPQNSRLPATDRINHPGLFDTKESFDGSPLSNANNMTDHVRMRMTLSNATLPTHTSQSHFSPPVNAQYYDTQAFPSQDYAMRKANQRTDLPMTPVYKNEPQDPEMRAPPPPSVPEIQNNARPKASRKSSNSFTRQSREIYKTPARRDVRQPIRYPEQETYNMHAQQQQETYNAVTNVKGQGSATTKNFNCTFNMGKGPPSGKTATPKKKRNWQKKNKTR